MPPPMRLTCPSVLELRYWRNGFTHRLWISVDINGVPIVSLRIGPQWSGWHGGWEHGSPSFLYVFARCNGRDPQRFTFLRLFDGDYTFFQQGYIRVSARMTTLLLTQRQLADSTDEWIEL